MPGTKKNRHLSMCEHHLLFRMCLVDGEESPRRKYYNLKDACREAERLAKLTSQDVFLLQAGKWVRYTPPAAPPELEWNTTVCGGYSR